MKWSNLINNNNNNNNKKKKGLKPFIILKIFIFCSCSNLIYKILHTNEYNSKKKKKKKKY